MDYKRILTAQDISCVGQCSLTVALPILSACGLETAVLPSAVLSTHTAGFTDFTVCDLTEEYPKIAAHWNREGIRFDAVYTGYLGSNAQICVMGEIMDTLLQPGAVKIVDPAMADNGALYPAFGMEYVAAMKTLCAQADIILPNITEACFLTDTPYREEYDEAYIQQLLEKLTAAGMKTVVLTGVGYAPDKTGVAVWERGKLSYYEHRRISKGCHGTGDVYASAFVGALLRGAAIFDAARIAADYVVDCIEYTQGDPEHWYGVKFEPMLPKLMARLELLG